MFNSSINCLFEKKKTHALHNSAHSSSVFCESLEIKTYLQICTAKIILEGGTCHDYEEPGSYHPSPGATDHLPKQLSRWRGLLYQCLLEDSSTFSPSENEKKKTKEVRFEHRHVTQICDIKQCRIFCLCFVKCQIYPAFVCFIDVSRRKLRLNSSGVV